MSFSAILYINLYIFPSLCRTLSPLLDQLQEPVLIFEEINYSRHPLRDSDTPQPTTTGLSLHKWSCLSCRVNERQEAFNCNWRYNNSSNIIVTRALTHVIAFNFLDICSVLVSQTITVVELFLHCVGPAQARQTDTKDCFQLEYWKALQIETCKSKTRKKADFLDIIIRT